jgi:hypothetical protein
MIPALLSIGIPDAQTRLTTANAEYELCPTYPQVLAVPAPVTDAELTQAAHFRSKRRGVLSGPIRSTVRGKIWESSMVHFVLKAKTGCLPDFARAVLQCIFVW